MSAPAPSAGQLGLALALQTPPMEQPKPRNAADSDVIEGDELIDYNKRIRELEQRAWDSLRCDTAQDVLNKLMCEEIHPALSSAVSFARDDHGIWKGALAVTSYGGESPTKGTEDGGDVGAKEPDSSATRDVPVLPISVQLRPFFEDRGPNGLFRLFFMDGELVAATQASPWAFYSEVSQNKDAVLDALKKFASSSQMRGLLRSYTYRANLASSSGAPSSDEGPVTTLPPITQAPG
jgi:hypothetical protein